MRSWLDPNSGRGILNYLRRVLQEAANRPKEDPSGTPSTCIKTSDRHLGIPRNPRGFVPKALNDSDVAQEEAYLG